MVVLGLALVAVTASPTLYRNPPQAEFRDKGVWVRIYYARAQLERGSFFGVPVETRHGAPDSLVLYANALEREAYEGRVLRRFSLKGSRGRHADFACAQGGGAFCAVVDLRAEVCAIQADQIGLTFQLPGGGMTEEVFPLQFRTDTALVTWFGKLLEGVPLYRHARALEIAEICAH